MKASRLSVSSTGSLAEAGAPCATSAASGGDAPLDHDMVSERARALWRERGCPMGRDEEIWLEAERQLSGVARTLGSAGSRKTEVGASGAGGGSATRTRRSRAA